MIADFHALESPDESAQNRDSRDWAAFIRRWMVFGFSSLPVIVLAIVRGTMLSICQDFDVELPLLIFVVLHPFVLCCLLLLPVVVLAKEFAHITSEQKRFADSALIVLSLLLSFIVGWTFFHLCQIMIHILDGIG